MNDINNRVKQLRDILHLSQDEFGSAIGLSKSGISSIENGIRNVTDKHIKLFVSAFNVNEAWLKYGSGEMFEMLSRDEELAMSIGRILANESEFAKNTFLALSRLDSSEWNVIENLIKSILVNNKSE